MPTSLYISPYYLLGIFDSSNIFRIFLHIHFAQDKWHPSQKTPRRLRYDTGGRELLRKYEVAADNLPMTENLEVFHRIDLEVPLEETPSA